MKRCYGKGTAYLFANFSLLALAFCILGPFIFLKKDEAEAAMGLLILGIPCAGISFLIWYSVKRKAKKNGLTNVMGVFVMDSILIFAKVCLMLSIICIPFAISLGNNIEWEERKTKDGRNIMVKKTGDGEYKDPFGNKFHEIEK